MKKAWFWSCHQVPISVIGSLPVTKKSAKFVAGNKIYDIFQRQVLAATIFLWNAPPPPPPGVARNSPLAKFMLLGYLRMRQVFRRQVFRKG